MRIFVITTALVMIMRLSLAQEAHFVYNDNGKHDPLWPLISPSGGVISYDASFSKHDLFLEGIIADAKGNNMAIINGKVVKAKDKMGSKVIESIGVDHVEVSDGQEKFVLKLKKMSL